MKEERINYLAWHTKRLFNLCHRLRFVLWWWHSLVHVNIIIILNICATNNYPPFLFFLRQWPEYCKSAKLCTFLCLIITCLWAMCKLDRIQIRLRLITFFWRHMKSYIYIGLQIYMHKPETVLCVAWWAGGNQVNRYIRQKMRIKP